MSYLSIKESIEFTNKSNSTIRNHIRTLKATGKNTFNNKEILSYKLLKNNSKQIFILKEYLEHVFISDKSNKTHFDTQVTSNNDSLIEALKDHIASLKKELDNKNQQINNFLVLEQRAMERLQEQNHIIHQLNIMIEDKQKTIEKQSKEVKKQPFKEDIETVENYQEQDIEETLNTEEEHIKERAQTISEERQKIINQEINKNQSNQDFFNFIRNHVKK
jgi:hypothetical protein